MEAYVCNRCEKVITNKELKRKMVSLKLSTERIGVFEEMHLCDGCMTEFHKFIKNEEMLESEE